MRTLRELKKKIEDIDTTYDYEDAYSRLYNTVIDYENEMQTWNFDYIFEDIINYDTAEEMAKQEIENGGLIRLYYFLGNANANNNLFKLDGYGNLQDITKDDLEYIKEEILDEIERLESEED